MRPPVSPFLLVACAVGLWAGSASVGIGAFERIRIAGQDYIRIGDWAKANGFEIRWLKQEESLQLTNPTTKLLLAVDHREMQINGTEVWLLFPIALRSGTAFISHLDLQTTLLPLLVPPRNPPKARVRTVCLDPGHGGKDKGYFIGSNQEKNYTLLLANEVRQQLSRAGLKVILTRSTDAFIELPMRPELAKRKGADLLVSLHFNAADASRDTAQGIEAYCLTAAGASSTNARGEGGDVGPFPGNRSNDRNIFLAYQVQKALTRNLAVQDRGVRRARFAVLRDATMPATLIEAGFMSHPVEGRKIFTAAYRQKLAQAIVEGVLAYKRQLERQ
jgi:N-acetylmuramoyl-L-alanine amidase